MQRATNAFSTCALPTIEATIGDRSWGQVRGVSCLLKAAHGIRGEEPPCGLEERKSGLEAHLRSPATVRFSLHGKDGVDGSSPSEGFREGQQKRPLVLPECAPHVPRRSGDLSRGSVPNAIDGASSWLWYRLSEAQSTSALQRPRAMLTMTGRSFPFSRYVRRCPRARLVLPLRCGR